jgi:hypothetical protein
MTDRPPLPHGYYGAKEAYGANDWRLGSILDNLSPAPITFWRHKIQYNQLDVHEMSCTICASAGAISDLTGYRFTNDQLSGLVEEAKQDDFSDSQGWYINKAIDLVRKWWKANNPDSDLSSYQIDLKKDKFMEALEKGYSVVTGYSGNSQYDQDVQADGILDMPEIGNPNYGHAIRLVRDPEKPDYVKLVVDNYYGYQKFNTYRIKKADFPKLVESQVFFHYGYIYVSDMQRMFKDVVRNNETDWYYQSLEWAVKEGLINGYEDGNFKPDEPISRAQMVVLMKRLYDKMNPPQP